MENLKRKRPEVISDERISTGKKIRSIKEAADDAELEEFLAIINRLQAGFKQFQAKGAGKSALTVTPPETVSVLWNPYFELDDFNQFHDGGRKIKTGDTTQNDAVAGFDLNFDPVADQKSD
ncbi:hypothetical protein SSX86_027726 [Deinandra increscens subsp. villosa]|uniref:Uncharacterized protein n=1 Tax=Deinandra increscens subsp. villosa TaxID=3103831 RepID=A0AAP0C7D2_9ASTR